MANSDAAKEISIIEMVVVDSFGIVACVIAHQSTPSIVTCKKEILLGGNVGQAVFEHLFQSRFAFFEQFYFTHFVCKCHIKCHLSQPFSAPVSIGAKSTFVGIFGYHLFHSLVPIGVFQCFVIFWSRIKWQHPIECVGYVESVSCGHLHFSAWSCIFIIAKRKI